MQREYYAIVFFIAATLISFYIAYVAIFPPAGKISIESPLPSNVKLVIEESKGVMSGIYNFFQDRKLSKKNFLKLINKEENVFLRHGYFTLTFSASFDQQEIRYDHSVFRIYDFKQICNVESKGNIIEVSYKESYVTYFIGLLLVVAFAIFFSL
jgi:hypothetical protein